MKSRKLTSNLFLSAVCAITLLLAPSVALATGGGGSGGPLRVVLTNDDSFETENIQALYDALVGAGHDVILSAPYTGQSGTSGTINILTPIPPTSEPSEKGTIPPGSPGVGPTTLGAQQFYVDGSPVDSLLYGIDEQAQAIWGEAPDLVVSGVNEGQNLGLIVPHSGTVGATVAALNRGIPAIAFSGGRDESAEVAELNAELALKVVEAVNGPRGIRLPPGTGLNVNFPDVDPETQSADDFTYELTVVGIASIVGLQFYDPLGDSAIANVVLPPQVLGFPGLSVDIPYDSGPYDTDENPKSEGNVLDDLVVTVSPIQGTYQADFFRTFLVKKKLRKLFD